jgi:hypothetical protein
MFTNSDQVDETKTYIIQISGPHLKKILKYIERVEKNRENNRQISRIKNGVKNPRSSNSDKVTYNVIEVL